MTDDQPYQTVDYMPTVRNVLAAQGINFERAFTTTPLCCPSRVSFLTGQYVHNHKVYTDGVRRGGAPHFKDDNCLPVWLHGFGYTTGYFGKYLNGYEELQPKGYVPPGWDEWGAFVARNIVNEEDKGSAGFYYKFSLSENGKIVDYRSRANYSADVLTKKAVNFIASERDKPFFLMVGYYNPHSPHIAADRHEEPFRDASEWIPWRPPDFNEADISDKPEYLRQISMYSPGEIDGTYRQIRRSLLAVDDGVASMLHELDTTGLRRKTIIVYLTDNGLTVGDHRFGFSKNCPYEGCIRSPLIVYAPGFYAPRTDSHLVENIDLAPTIAAWAGAKTPAKVDGMSLLPLLENEQAAWRDDVLIEHWRTENGVGSIIPNFSAIRTDRWKYVEYETGERELYDLQGDPYELYNLARNPGYESVISQLAGRLAILKSQ
jgi:arylsulfatase A-like enzyme